MNYLSEWHGYRKITYDSLQKKKKNAQGTLKNTSAYFRNYSMK